MLHTDAILEMDAVAVTGPSAVGMIGSLREEGGKDAMLHVKHRHVLMDREFEPFWRCISEQIKHLGDVEVIADGEALHRLFHEKLCGERVGHIE